MRRAERNTNCLRLFTCSVLSLVHPFKRQNYFIFISCLAFPFLPSLKPLQQMPHHYSLANNQYSDVRSRMQCGPEWSNFGKIFLKSSLLLKVQVKARAEVTKGRSMHATISHDVTPLPQCIWFSTCKQIFPTSQIKYETQGSEEIPVIRSVDFLSISRS